MARTVRVPARYNPQDEQEAFHRSKATFKFYGGAMGGGKTRALCEEALQAALDYPGIEIIVARKEHKSITITTRKTFFREVLPQELREFCRVLSSGSDDFIQFPNGPGGATEGGSVIHFAGMNNAEQYHSAEFGLVIFDEAHQIDEDDVQSLNTRLRQKCRECLETQAEDCEHLPHQILFGANPSEPGHFLHRWFIQGADKTEWGRYKAELWLDEDSDEPIGASEFIFANAYKNKYLPKTYIKRRLASMKPLLRRRYLEGEWLHVSGTCFFDVDRLAEYEETTPKPKYRMDFEPVGIGDKAKFRKHDLGKVRVYAEPVEGHSYAIGADVATGRGLDYSCAYVVDLHDMGLVAEFHGKLDADVFAEQLHFLGKWYASALLAVESAGGWGEPVVISLRDGKGGRPPYPRLYRHTLDTQVDLPLVRRYGYPINTKTRPQVLNQLERAVRDGALPWMTPHLISECLTFCEFEEGTPSPRAQPKSHDDAVMAAAITLELYRQKGHHPEREERIRNRRWRPRVKRHRTPLGATNY